MSSGERAKPPATFEERNPFDISRRSGTEVAAEIARRMAAWKRARGRSGTPAPGAAPEEGTPPMPGPVQPARPEKEPPSAHPRQPVPGGTMAARPPRAPSAGQREARAPFFATFSVRRPMAAPDPRQPAGAPPAAGSAGAAQPTGDQPAREAQAPSTRNEPPAGTTVAAAAPAMPDIVAAAPHAAAEGAADHPETAGPATSPSAAAERGPDRPADDRPLPGGASDLAAASAAADVATPPPAAAAEGERTPPAPVEAAPADPLPELASEETARAGPSAAAAAEQELAPASAAPDIPPAELTAVAAERAVAEDREAAAPTAPAAAAISTAPAREPAAPDAPSAAAEEIERRRAKARTLKARWMAARGFDGLPSEDPSLREPEASTPAPQAAGADSNALPARAPQSPAAAPEIVAAASLQDVPEVGGTTGAPSRGEAEDAAEARVERAPAAGSRIPSIEALEAMSGRREPTLDLPQPAARAESAAAPPRPGARKERAAAASALPRIETRIEARRLAALRADPALAGRGTVPGGAALEVPSPYPASARRGRGGTGWAIGLGAALLIIGITAPAAIWQQERRGMQSDADRVVMNPAPLPPSEQAGPSAPSSLPALPPDLAQLPGPREPYATAGDAPASPPLAGALPEPELKPGSAPGPGGAPAALGAVEHGGLVADAPVSAPPPPWMSAQVPLARPLEQPFSGRLGPVDPSASPMVPRPFVPEGAARPLVPPSTAGEASVPVAGAAANGSPSASVAVKPALMGQLKPKVPAARKPVEPQSSVRKPRPLVPKSLDQMFQQLVDSLSNGQPANPATRPPAPSQRR